MSCTCVEENELVRFYFSQDCYEVRVHVEKLQTCLLCNLLIMHKLRRSNYVLTFYS